MKVSTLFTGSFLLFFLVLLVISLHYPAEVRLFPWLFIIPGIILGVLQILKETRAEEEGQEELKFGAWLRLIKNPEQGYLAALLWIAGLLLSLYLVGFVLAIPIFTILYLRTHGESWLFSLTLTVLGWGILFAVFALGLKMTFYKGLLFALY